MEFRILGPLEVGDEGRQIVLPAAKQRALLAILLLHANEPVSGDRLIEELWGGRPPASARKVLQTYVSKLRRVLGAEAVETGPAGYALHVEPAQLDLHRFGCLVAEAREARPREAAGKLRAALSLWRGPPLADFVNEPFAQTEIARLEELRLAALEERIDTDLALGRHGELVGELDALVTQHPMRERYRWHSSWPPPCRAPVAACDPCPSGSSAGFAEKQRSRRPGAAPDPPCRDRMELPAASA